MNKLVTMTTANVFIAGICASLGGLFGKLSGVSFFGPSLGSYCIQLCCLVCMVSFNSATWPFYVRAQQESSAFQATVICSTVNFILSGIFGVLLGETTGWMWCLGLCFILFGVFLIHTSKDKATKGD